MVSSSNVAMKIVWLTGMLSLIIPGVVAEETLLRGLQSLDDMWNVQEPVLIQQGNEYTIAIQHGMGDGVSYPLWNLYLSNTAKTGKDACPFASGQHEARLSIDNGILPTVPMDGFEFTSLISVVGQQGTSSLSFEFDTDQLTNSDAVVVDEANHEAKIAFCVLFALQTDHRIVNARQMPLDIHIRLDVGVGGGAPTEADEQPERTIDLPEPPSSGHDETEDPSPAITKQQEQNIMEFEQVMLPESSAISTMLVSWIAKTILVLLVL